MINNDIKSYSSENASTKLLLIGSEVKKKGLKTVYIYKEGDKILLVFESMIKSDYIFEL